MPGEADERKAEICRLVGRNEGRVEATGEGQDGLPRVPRR